jgi:perosamine synthetase
LGLESDNVIAVSSGSSALFLALNSMQIKDKNVGLPTYCCSAIRNSISLAGGKLIYIDNVKNEPYISVSELSSSKVDALVLVHPYGIPVEIGSYNRNFLIEDFSQAFGAKFKNEKFVGTEAKIGIASFSATKMLTTGGQGGIIVSEDSNMIQEMRDYLNFDGRTDSKNSFNFDLTEIQAAIGVQQLKKFESFRKKREEIFEIYRLAGLNLLESYSKGKSVKYRAVIKVDEPDRIISELKKRNIDAIVPLKYQELLYRGENMVNAIEFSKHTVSLPIYPKLSHKIAKEISNIVKKVI